MKMLIILALLIPQMATARIGETMAECIERYGEPIDKPLAPNSSEITFAFFTKGGFEIQVDALNGVCQCITYKKKDETATEAETLKLILSKNHDSWRMTKDGLTGTRWCSQETGLGKYTATYLRRGRILSITTQQYTDDRDKKKSEKREKSVDGF
jgi:hypothetical protein